MKQQRALVENATLLLVQVEGTITNTAKFLAEIRDGEKIRGRRRMLVIFFRDEGNAGKQFG